MLSKIKQHINNLIDYYNDYRQWSRSHSNEFVLANLERRMLLTSHSLEKGMSFKVKKQNWGGKMYIPM